MIEITNEAVAKQVMGWTEIPTGTAYWRDSDGDEEGPFFPLEHAGDDHRVFVKVCGWRDSLRNIDWCRFYKHLLDLWQSRDPYYPSEPNTEQIYWLHHYAVGDYSRAAMMAIKQSEES